MTERITHEDARAIIDRCMDAFHSPDPVERLKLAAYVDQSERERLGLLHRREMLLGELEALRARAARAAYQLDMTETWLAGAGSLEECRAAVAHAMTSYDARNGDGKT